jgi:hypothetical protein
MLTRDLFSRFCRKVRVSGILSGVITNCCTKNYTQSPMDTAITAGKAAPKDTFEPFGDDDFIDLIEQMKTTDGWELMNSGDVKVRSGVWRGSLFLLFECVGCCLEWEGS